VSKAKRNQAKRAKQQRQVEGGQKTGTAPIAQFQIPRPEVNEHIAITIAPQFTRNGPGPAPGGSPGAYEVALILGVPGVNSVVGTVIVDDWSNSGDSLLASDGLTLDLLTEDGSSLGTARFVANRARRLARVHLTVHADTFADAEQHAHDAVMPVLSWLAFDGNVAVEVVATAITECATGTRQVSARMMGQVQAVTEPRGWSTSKLRPFLAAYREGLNSTSPLYQAISFYKIIEGAKAFHKRRTREAPRAGSPLPPDPLMQAIPSDAAHIPGLPEWTRPLFTPYLDQTFDEVDKAVKSTIRDAAAHLAPDFHRVSDYLEDVRACRAVVPVLRYIARELIHNELQFVPARPAPPAATTASAT
jgi:hypothetical protein